MEDKEIEEAAELMSKFWWLFSIHLPWESVEAERAPDATPEPAAKSTNHC